MASEDALLRAAGEARLADGVATLVDEGDVDLVGVLAGAGAAAERLERADRAAARLLRQLADRQRGLDQRVADRGDRRLQVLRDGEREGVAGGAGLDGDGDRRRDLDRARTRGVRAAL